MARLTSHDFSSDDESFPSLDFLAPKRVASKTMSPAKRSTSSSSAVDKENAPPQPPRTLKSRRHADIEASAPGSMAKPTPLRRRKLGNSQAVDESLFQKWGDIEPLRKEKKERLVSNPRSLRLKASNLTLGSHQQHDSSGDLTSSLDQTTSLDFSLSDSDDTIVRRKRSPRKVSGNSKSPEKKRPVTVFDESSEEEEEEEDDDEEDDEEEEEDSAASAESLIEKSTVEKSMVETSKVAKDEKDTSDSEESDFVTALSLDTDCSESSASEFEVDKPVLTKKAPAGENQAKGSRATKASSSRSSPVDELSDASDASDSESTPHTPSRKTTRRAIKKPSADDDLDDAFKKLKIFSEENDDDEDKQPKLNPVTPRKVLLPSPTKGPKIPTSPWKPEHQEFWDPEVQNKWIDDHSPHKQASPRKLAMDGGDVNTKAALKLKYGTSPEKRNAKKAFNLVKESVAERFLAELDEKVTEGQLAKMTAATGGITIKWSTTLQSTAGRAHWKCKETSTMTEQADGTMASSGKQKLHTAHIELATKVLLNEPDLLNTVAHEFCHLATFILDGKPKAAHGAEFKRWGARCSRVFGDRGIVVTTKHNYEIEYKYIWRCVECLTEVQRHSKSVDPVKHRCGRCKGVLQQVKPVPRGSAAAAGKAGESGPGGEKKEKKVSAYQEFTGQQMKALKAENKDMTFKEMMAIVSTRWKAHQAALKAATDATTTTGEADKTVTQITETMEEMTVMDMST